MENTFDFQITSASELSLLCLQRNLSRFSQAARFVRNLPYRRNSDKADLSLVLKEGCGTCGTKHAFLKELANENNINGIDLVLSIFKMNGSNTPAVAKRLHNAGLPYVPEAHNYLRHKKNILDFTAPGFNPQIYENDILQESSIGPYEMGDEKVKRHKQFLKHWLKDNPQISYSLDELWSIREGCIADLEKKDF